MSLPFCARRASGTFPPRVRHVPAARKRRNPQPGKDVLLRNSVAPENGVSKSGEIRRSLGQKIRFLPKNGLIKSSQSAIIKLVFYQDISAGLFRQKKSAFPCTRLRALYHIPFYTA